MFFILLYIILFIFLYIIWIIILTCNRYMQPEYHARLIFQLTCGWWRWGWWNRVLMFQPIFSFSSLLILLQFILCDYFISFLASFIFLSFCIQFLFILFGVLCPWCCNNRFTFIWLLAYDTQLILFSFS